MKKYIIRIIGALCIIGAVAAMFLLSWFKIDGIKRSDLRNLRDDTCGVIKYVGDSFVEKVSVDDNFSEELKDNDLPSSRSAVKKQFREIGDLLEGLLDENISLQEVLTLSIKAPGIIEDAENLVDSSVGASLISVVTDYQVNEAREENPDAVFSEEKLTSYKRQLRTNLEEGVETASEIKPVFTKYV